MKKWFAAASAVLLGAAGLVAACVGDSTVNPTDVGDEGGTSGGGTDGGGPGSGKDGAAPGDGGSASCKPGCADPQTLLTCFTDGGSAMTTCAFDCTSDGGDHCRAFVPSEPILANDTVLTGLADVTVGNAFMSSDDGTLDNVRGANATPGVPDTQQGVRFHVRNNVGIYTMKSLTVPAGVTLKLRGTAAIAIVADKIDIQGVIDARGFAVDGTLCKANVAGPGGYPGGNGAGAGAGPGGGAASTNASGGGGGGAFGADAGNGGSAGAGIALGGHSQPFAIPIVGGSGGGSCTGQSSPGGGGGGAVHLVGLTEVKIGTSNADAGVNAGGCGGKGNDFAAGGAGGGSGGAILIESPAVTLHDTATLAANGGGGGSGNTNPGQNGPLSGNPAYGDLNGNSNAGGTGGASGVVLGTFIYGGNGGNGTSGTLGAGGGGGSAGRIWIANGSGALNPTGNVMLSPALGTGAATVSRIGLK